MGHHYGAYTWTVFWDEGGHQIELRSTGTTDTNKGTLYRDRAGNDIWLKTRSSPAEGGGHRFGGPTHTPYQDTLKVYVPSQAGIPWLQTKATPNI
jgi:hypothetical protein